MPVVVQPVLTLASFQNKTFNWTFAKVDGTDVVPTEQNLRVLNQSTNQYTSYDTNNPANALILSQKNAGNIAYLKERLDSYNDVHKQVQDLSGNYDVLEKQVNDLVTAQQDYANQITGGVVPEISGIDEDEDEENPSASDLIIE
jgi:hypothetical protein